MNSVISSTPATTAQLGSDLGRGVVTPYLCFYGRCEEALAFYEGHLGAKIVSKAHFRDIPDGGCEGLPRDNVMHAVMRIGQSEVFATDGCPDELVPTGAGRISLSFAVQEPDTVEHLTTVLAEHGKVIMPATETFFARRFAVVTDRFGISWMLIAPKQL